MKKIGGKASYLRSYQEETCDLRDEDRGRMFQAEERAFWGAGKEVNLKIFFNGIYKEMLQNN